MDVVFLVGRILFAALFLGASYGHLAQTRAMAGYAESRGVPMARLAVQGSGVLLVLGALSVSLGVWGDLGALLLVVFLVSTAVMMHGFWAETDPMAKQMELVQFQKDLALAGASLVVFVMFSDRDVGLTLTGPLLGLG